MLSLIMQSKSSSQLFPFLKYEKFWNPCEHITAYTRQKIMTYKPILKTKNN